MVALSVRELEKRFGDVPVLRGVDVEVPDGALAVLVGPSGCGKSTLLRLLAGLELPTSGSIRFGEREVSRLPPRDRDVAMVFQSYALYPHLTVRDNLGFGLKLKKTPRAEITRRVGEVAEMLGLDPLLDRMPRQLSGGQRQRVAMGRAIVRRPAMFLFDEPLSNLDAALRSQVRVDIKKLHRQLGTTSVYVTHDQVEAMTLADVMFVLNAGRVEQSGPPLEVYDRPATRFVAGFLGSPAMNFLPGVLSTEAGEPVVRLDGEVLLPAGEGLEPGREVTVGVRAHHLRPSRERREGALPMTVDLAEALGDETFVYGHVAGQALVARLPPRFAAEPGEVLWLEVEQLHLFDAESGAALRPAV